MINLTRKELATVKDILAKEIPDCEVWAFGSRIKGEAKSYSDLDLVIVGKEKVERGKMSKLKRVFQESSLPFRVEILDWNRIPDHFKKIIESDYVVIQSLPK